MGIQKDKNVTVSALFGVAVLLFFWGGINWFISGVEPNRLGVMLCLSGFVYVALGILAYRTRLLAALLGALLYAAFLTFECIFDINHGVNLLMTGLFFKIPIIILLLAAAVSPLKCSIKYKTVIGTLVIAIVISQGYLAHALWLNALWKTEVSVQAVSSGAEQSRRDFKNGKLRLYDFHGENTENKFSGRYEGQFEIWHAEYHPAVYAQKVAEEKWVEGYNQLMKLQSSQLSDPATDGEKSK